MAFILEIERSRGCLLGLAVGDALGAPFEGGGRPERWCRRMEPDGRCRRPPGAVTDDTLQAVAVAESLIACRGFSGSDLAVRLLEGFRAHPEYYGPTSTRVFSLIEAGVDPATAARLVHEERGSSRTNGPVMRGPPIGIVYAGRTVEEVSMAAARLTHYDPVAGAASGFVNRMASETLPRAEPGGRIQRGSCRLPRARNPRRPRFVADAPVRPVPRCARTRSCCHRGGHDHDDLRQCGRSRGEHGRRQRHPGGCRGGARRGRVHGAGAIPRDWLAPLELRRRLVELADGLVRIAR